MTTCQANTEHVWQEYAQADKIDRCTLVNTHSFTHMHTHTDYTGTESRTHAQTSRQNKHAQTTETNIQYGL